MDGDLAGRLSLSASERPGRSRDLDRPLAFSWFGLSSRGGEERLSVRLPELDFVVLSLDLSVLSEGFLSFDLLLPRPLSLPVVSLGVLVTFSCFGSLTCPSLSADLLRLRRLEADLLPSVESRRDFPPFAPLGDVVFPELPL